jgi:valyl-tRNA synthetase
MSLSDPLAKWIVYQVKQMLANVETAMENYRLDEAINHLYHCLWDSFCDWYVEFTKPILQQSSIIDEEKHSYNLPHTLLKKDIRDTTAWAILQFVRILYPIAPFISKKLSGEMGVIDMAWPEIPDLGEDFVAAAKDMDLIKSMVSSLRSMKQCLQIPLGKEINARVESSDPRLTNLIFSYGEILLRMAGVRIGETHGQTAPIVVGSAIIHVDLGDEVNAAEEVEKLRNEIYKLEKVRDDSMARLSNQDFLQKASEVVIQEHQTRVAEIDDKIQKINYILQSLEVV